MPGSRCGRLDGTRAGHWAISSSYLACLRLLAKVSLRKRATDTESKAALPLDTVMTAWNATVDIANSGPARGEKPLASPKQHT